MCYAVAVHAADNAVAFATVSDMKFKDPKSSHVMKF